MPGNPKRVYTTRKPIDYLTRSQRPSAGHNTYSPRKGYALGGEVEDPTLRPDRLSRERLPELRTREQSLDPEPWARAPTHVGGPEGPTASGMVRRDSSGQDTVHGVTVPHRPPARTIYEAADRARRAGGYGPGMAYEQGRDPAAAAAAKREAERNVAKLRAQLPSWAGGMSEAERAAEQRAAEEQELGELAYDYYPPSGAESDEDADSAEQGLVVQTGTSGLTDPEEGEDPPPPPNYNRNYSASTEETTDLHENHAFRDPEQGHANNKRRYMDYLANLFLRNSAYWTQKDDDGDDLYNWTWSEEKGDWVAEYAEGWDPSHWGEDDDKYDEMTLGEIMELRSNEAWEDLLAADVDQLKAWEQDGTKRWMREMLGDKVDDEFERIRKEAAEADTPRERLAPDEVDASRLEQAKVSEEEMVQRARREAARTQALVGQTLRGLYNKAAARGATTGQMMGLAGDAGVAGAQAVDDAAHRSKLADAHRNLQLDMQIWNAQVRWNERLLQGDIDADRADQLHQQNQELQDAQEQAARRMAQLQSELNKPTSTEVFMAFAGQATAAGANVLAAWAGRQSGGDSGDSGGAE